MNQKQLAFKLSFIFISFGVIDFVLKYHYVLNYSGVACFSSSCIKINFYERTFCNGHNYFERRDKVDCMDLFKVGPEFAIKWTTSLAAEPSKLFDEPTFIY